VWPRLGYFVFGLASAPIIRSILREVVKTGYLATHEAKRIVAEAKADAEDLLAEGKAKAEGTPGEAGGRRHTN
jgi:hypothetical protein